MAGRSPAPRALLRRWVLTGVTAVVGACVVVLVGGPPAWALATLPQVIDNCRNWITGISAGVATLFLTIGGLRYSMANGDPGEVESAKRALRSAAVGYGIAALAPVLAGVVKSIVGAP